MVLAHVRKKCSLASGMNSKETHSPGQGSQVGWRGVGCTPKLVLGKKQSASFVRLLF